MTYQAVGAGNGQTDGLPADVGACPDRRVIRSRSLLPLCAVLLAFLLLPGCNALNPLCRSTRPRPIADSLTPTTIPLTELEQGFLLTVNGSHFVASSVVIINGTTMETTVVTSHELQVTLPTHLVSSAGTADVTVSTPAGNSQYEGCTSGGTSQILTLDVT